MTRYSEKEEASSRGNLQAQLVKESKASSLRDIDDSERSSISKRGLSKSLHGERAQRKFRETLGKSLKRLSSTPRNAVTLSPMRSSGHIRSMRKLSAFHRDDLSTGSIDASVHRNGVQIPYFEKLCWMCEYLDYPFEYADIIGSQFLSLDGASPVTHVDGHVPTMDELVEFLSRAYIAFGEFADLRVLFIDDFQWVDSFSWKVFRELCQHGSKVLLVCAMRSHDKQALRRLSTAATRQSQLQSQMTEISLGPLVLGEVRELISIVLEYDRDTIPDGICTDIHQRSGGLPVYVVQVLENIKRNKTLELGEDQVLRWTAAGLKEKVCAPHDHEGLVGIRVPGFH